MEMDGEASKTLPEHLVETIIAMMPYPSIFKARLLSKSWHDRFEPISRLNTADAKGMAKSFHRRVAEWSHKWDTFCSVCRTEDDKMKAYNQITQKWQSLPSLDLITSLPTDVSDRVTLFIEPPLEGSSSEMHHVRLAVRCVRIQGAFLLATDDDHLGSSPNFRVANILTKEWKDLTRRPEDILKIELLQLVTDKDAYKLMVVCQGLEMKLGEYFAQIYDSKTESWSINHITNGNSKIGYRFWDSSSGPYVYFNGVFYKVTMDDWHCLKAFNVETGTFEELRLSFAGEIQITKIKLVIRNGDLVIIVLEMHSVTLIRVLKIDLESRTLLEVARCPISNLDANSDFFRMAVLHDLVPILKSDESLYEWPMFLLPVPAPRYHWTELSFPGLNPFMAV